MLRWMALPRSCTHASTVVRRSAALALGIFALLSVAAVDAYGQITIGRIQVELPSGGRLSIDQLAIEEASYNPGALRLDELMAMTRSPGPPDQILEQLAKLVEGAELR